MPQIPDWTAVGTSTPTPTYRRVEPDNSGVIEAGGLDALGRGLEDVGNDQYLQQQQLLTSKADGAVLDHRLAVAQTAETLKQQIATGDVPYAQARQQFDQQVQQIPTPNLDGLHPKVQQELQGDVSRNLQTAQFGIDSAVDAARKDDFKAQFGLNLDKLGKLAGMPDANIDDINNQAEVFRPLGRSAGLPEAYIDKALQNFKDQNWFNQATQRSMESKESLPALQDLQHDLTDQDGFYAGKLDTDKRNILLRGVIDYTGALQNRIERQQDKQEIHGQMTLNRIDQQIASGVPASPQLWATWQDAVKGTGAEGEFNQRVQDEATVQDVLRKPIDQQWAYVQQRQQELDQQGGSVHDAATLQRLSAAVNANTQLMKTTPLLFDARRNGSDIEALDLPHLGTPDGDASIAGEVQERMATLTSMRKQYGPQVPLTPLLPQEASQVASQLQNLPPVQRAQMLVSLHSAFRDDDAYQAAMDQIAPHSPVTAIAGQMAGKASLPSTTPVWFDQRYAPNPQQVALVLSGESLLNPVTGGKQAALGQETGKGALRGGMPMPEDSLLRSGFARQADGLFPGRPQLADAYFSTFKAADAALRAQVGDFRGQPNVDIENKAYQIALGTRVQFNGDKFSAPAGMDPTRFTGLVQNAVAGAAAARNLPADWPDRMRGYRLSEIGGLGSGRYELLNGNMQVIAPFGQPFQIDLRNQYSPAGGGHGSPQDILRQYGGAPPTFHPPASAAAPGITLQSAADAISNVVNYKGPEALDD